MKDLFVLSNKDDATQFPIPRWSLARPVDGISTLGLTQRCRARHQSRHGARRYVAFVLSRRLHFPHVILSAIGACSHCIGLPLPCCLVWDGGLCLSKVTGCSMMRQKKKKKKKPHSARDERHTCRPGDHPRM